MRNKALVVVLLFVYLFTFSACTASWKTTATTGFDITGTTLTEVGTSAKQLCSSGQVSVDNCVKLKEVYNTAREAYLTAGQALIIAMETEDAVKKKDAMALYTTSINTLSTLVPQLIKLAGDLGVKVNTTIPAVK